MEHVTAINLTAVTSKNRLNQPEIDEQCDVLAGKSSSQLILKKIFFFQLKILSFKNEGIGFCFV